VIGSRRAVVAIVLSAAAACGKVPAPAPPPPGPSTASVRAAVDSQLAKLIAAYRNRDGSAFAAIYTTDGISSSPRGTLTGRPAIEAAMQKAFADGVTISGDSAITEDFVVAGDRAVQSGHLTWTQSVQSGKPANIRLDFVFSWHRDADGTWRIQRDLAFPTTRP